MLNQIKALWATEPARVTTATVAIVVFVAAKLGVVVDQQNVGEALALLLPIVLGGEIARSRVSPDTGRVGPASDAMLPPEVVGRGPR